MDLTRYVTQLQQQLSTGADGLGDDARVAADRLASVLDAATRLTLLEALSDAASEITAELAPGSVDVRLRGKDPEFVVLAPATATPAPAAGPAPAPATATTPAVDAPEPETDDAATTRTTLRLPEHVKLRAEAAAVREGISLNTWLVRAVAAALDGSAAARPTAAPTVTTGNRYTGWVR